LIARAPFDGPVSVRVGEATHPLDRRLAQTIYIEER
jgi:DtxR family Mn-dependent transcriptional regulator